MSLNEKEIFNKLVSYSNKQQAEKNLYQLKKIQQSFQNDKLLGVSMYHIKDLIKEIETIEISTVLKLVQSEYNELRILGWALLIRDFSESSILKYFILHESKNCGNWNVVDFAAPICSKMLIKKDGYEACENVGYSLLFAQQNSNSIRFSIMMSLPFIQKEKLRFGIDVVERCLDIKDSNIQQACGKVLKEIGLVNNNILNYFLKNNYSRLSVILKKEID